MPEFEASLLDGRTARQLVEECAAHVVEAVRVVENERERLRRDLQRRSEVRAFIREEPQCVTRMAMVEVTTPMQQ